MGKDGLIKKTGTVCLRKADTPETGSATGGAAGIREPDLLLGSGLSFVDAFLDALGTTMTTAIKFLGAFNLFMGHEIAP